MTKNKIKFGVGSFTCYRCKTTYTIAEKSVIIILDDKGEEHEVCKFCVKKLEPEDYERIYHPRFGLVFTKRSEPNKILYKIKKKLGLDY